MQEIQDAQQDHLSHHQAIQGQPGQGYCHYQGQGHRYAIRGHCHNQGHLLIIPNHLCLGNFQVLDHL